MYIILTISLTTSRIKMVFFVFIKYLLKMNQKMFNSVLLLINTLLSVIMSEVYKYLLFYRVYMCVRFIFSQRINSVNYSREPGMADANTRVNITPAVCTILSYKGKTKLNEHVQWQLTSRYLINLILHYHRRQVNKDVHFRGFCEC